MDFYIYKTLGTFVIMAFSIKTINTTLLTGIIENNTISIDNNTEQNFLEEDEYSRLDEIAPYVRKVEIWCYRTIAPILLVIGVTGNILSILVLRR